jgi:hypothetical protein
MFSMHAVRNTISRLYQRRITAPMLLLLALVSLGCDKTEMPVARAPVAKPVGAGVGAGSPYADYLPKAAPADANRFTHPAGFSIVCPPGWTPRIIELKSSAKDFVADQVMLEGTQPDRFKPVIIVQRLGPEAGSQWDDLAKTGATMGNGHTRTKFQGEPAFTRFQAGTGKSRAVKGQHKPWLSQRLVLKSHGQWFLLDFRMRNADDEGPYYTAPLKIIQDYFETFRYKPPGSVRRAESGARRHTGAQGPGISSDSRDSVAVTARIPRLSLRYLPLARLRPDIPAS